MPTKAEIDLQNAEVSVEFESMREELLIKEAVRGRDASDWIHSPLGRFVVGVAVHDQREIEEKLTKINPNTGWRRRKIQELQLEHAAIGRAVSYLTECVDVGLSAERELKQPQE